MGMLVVMQVVEIWPGAGHLVRGRNPVDPLVVPSRHASFVYSFMAVVCRTTSARGPTACSSIQTSSPAA